MRVINQEKSACEALNQVIMDQYDLAVATLWREHVEIAVRLYLKALTISPEDCHIDVLDEATRHLVAAGAIDAKAVATIGTEIGVESQIIAAILVGKVQRDKEDKSSLSLRHPRGMAATA